MMANPRSPEKADAMHASPEWKPNPRAAIHVDPLVSTGRVDVIGSKQTINRGTEQCSEKIGTRFIPV